MEKSFALEDFRALFTRGNKYYPPRSEKRSGTGFWYRFCKLFPQHKPFLKKPSDITKIISAYHKNMIQVCIENRSGAEFPEGLGVLFVGAYKTSKNINFGISNKLRKKVYFRNLHTDNLAACIYYDTSNCSYVHNELWEFHPHVSFSKSVSEAFKKNWNLYLRLETIWSAISFRRSAFMRGYAIKKQNELLIDYNEFYIS